MKKIIKSAFLVVAIAAIAGYATYSFFSDTEESTGNTFTAGAIDLKVDSQAHYNNMVCDGSKWVAEPNFNPPTGHFPAPNSTCGVTWGQSNGKDIVGEKFFEFADLKPGDNGENTVSLHVDSNPAWACAKITVTSDDDMTCTDPEIKNEESAHGICAPNTSSNPFVPQFDGEIAKNLSLAWWADNGDNVLEDSERSTLFFESTYKLNNILEVGGTNNRSLYLTLADKNLNFFKNTHSAGQPLNNAQNYWVGIAWCFGDMSIDESENITCNGSSVDNQSQTDSLKADIEFRVEQARNNPDFSCTDSYGT